MTNEEREALIAQGWTPPKVVGPDEKWAHAYTKELFDPMHTVNPGRAYDYFLGAIKEGRALAAAEAKPGMVWKEHDGSEACPVSGKVWVVAIYEDVEKLQFSMEPRNLSWYAITHYCEITLPEEK